MKFTEIKVVEASQLGGRCFTRLSHFAFVFRILVTEKFKFDQGKSEISQENDEKILGERR